MTPADCTDDGRGGLLNTTITWNGRRVSKQSSLGIIVGARLVRSRVRVGIGMPYPLKDNSLLLSHLEPSSILTGSTGYFRSEAPGRTRTRFCEGLPGRVRTKGRADAYDGKSSGHKMEISVNTFVRESSRSGAGDSRSTTIRGRIGGR